MIILVFLIWFIFFGVPNFSKRLKKQVIKRREILEAEKEPLLRFWAHYGHIIYVVIN